MEEVPLEVLKEFPVEYDRICAFFDEYEEKRRRDEPAGPSLYPNDKYWIRYGFKSKDFLQFILIDQETELRKVGDKVVEQVKEEINLFKQFKLKFHVGLPENDPEMYRLGWQIVVNILTQYNVINFKFVRKGKKMSSAEGQVGKDMTIYAHFDARGLEDIEGVFGWTTILKEIEMGLWEANISVGELPRGTAAKPQRYVSGGRYISYRYHPNNPERDPLEIIDLRERQCISRCCK